VNRLRICIAAVAVGAMLVAAVPARAATITFSGSTSIFPLMVGLVKEYKREGHRGFSAAYSQGGSDIGINDVAHGRVTLGAASRDPLPSDPHGLIFTRIAFDAVCVITNNANPLANIDQGQVQSIFSGQTSDWGAVPGARVQGPVQLEVRTAASGTQDAFQNIFLGQNVTVAGSADQQGSNGLVQQSVGSNPQAIGYVSLNFSRGVHPVPYQGVPCTLRNAKSRQYGGVRNFWVVSRGRVPSGPASAFVNWIRHTRGATRVVSTNWVPIH